MDTYKLKRFVDAQSAVYDQVRSELRKGRKQSHWMWFIFPQLKGLGLSATAIHFSLASQAEAAAYLGHPVLGVRLRECSRLVNEVEGRTAREIFGSPDDLKFRSSMTLFSCVAEEDSVFETALAKYFAGQPDKRTLKLLEADGKPR